MKLSSSNVNFHLQLEGVKGEMAQALLQFSNILKQSLLVDVLKSSTINGDQNQLENGTSFSSFKCQVDYIRSFLQMSKLFPKDVRLELGCKVLRDCDDLLKSVFHEMVKPNKSCEGSAESNETDPSDQQQVVSLLILPTGQLMHECIDMNLAVLNGGTEIELESALKYSMNIFSESVRFLISPTGMSLGKPDFLRIMGLSQKVWKFLDHVKHLSTCPEFEAASSKIIESMIENIEANLTGCILYLLSSENGRSFVKFWCEILNSGKAQKICTSLKQLSSSSTNFPEIYMIFTSYLQQDVCFWRTDIGKSITPILIRGIMLDMCGDKVETKKRAAFVLKLLVARYSQNMPIFDMKIPEVSFISLNNMEPGEYTKFWDAYFDIHDILNETQLHIVQPVLQKLQIFQKYSSNDSVLVWLPILLRKMISHDNRSVVKEGFEQFLQTGLYLEKGRSSLCRQLAINFLEKHILPLIRDHIGWILNEPSEFFKNIGAFGQFLQHLYSDQELAQFRAAEVILDFLTSSGKCMGPHTIFFLVASLDEILCDRNDTMMEKSVSEQNITSSMDMMINQLSLLLSNNLTTVSKFFRELLEHRCVSILSNIMPYVKNLPTLQLESFLFMKLLTFLGSLSVKVFYDKTGQEGIQRIIEAFNQKEPNLLNQLTFESKLYEFTKSNLSCTSVIGLLRFLSISSQFGNKEISDRIQEAIERFNWSNVNGETLSGSIQGLHEFYHHNSSETLTVIYVKILNEICEILNQKSNQCSEDLFMYCVRRLEMIENVPREVSLPKMNSSFCTFKRFLLQRLYILKESKDISQDVSKEFNCKRLVDFDSMESISDKYFAVTTRNVFADYHKTQFLFYTTIMTNNAGKDELCNLLSLIVDDIEKCDSSGVAAGLLLAKSVAKLIDNSEEWDGSRLLDEIASVGWSLVFELRKSERFWLGIKAFVELISCPYFVQNGYLNKYAELIFEQGENVFGLPLVLVQHLVQIEYPEQMLGKVHTILVKAALAGGPLPKNNRVSFAIWDYLRRNANTEDYNDPENFSSDCKARLLACEKLRSNIDYLLSTEDSKPEALTLLHDIVLSLLERDEFESKKRKRYFQGSTTHRIKHRIYQLLLTLQPYFNFEISKMALEKVLHSLSTDSPQPSVRYMGEWLIILVVQQYPELKTLFFDCLDNCIGNRLGFGAFFSTICLQASKFLECPTFYDRALQSLASLTLSQHLTVRIYSQTAFEKIYERTVELNFATLTDKYAPILSALSRASVYVSGNCSKLLENVSQDFYVNVFDSKTHYSPEVIFTLLPRLSGMIKDECILQPVTVRKLTQLQRAQIGVGNLEKIYMDHEKSAWHLKTVVADGRELGEELPNEETFLKTPQKTQNNEMNYQKKINPWKLLTASEEIEEYSNILSKKRCIAEEGLIVVASLLDHLPNLGGLCRTCEIFGVHKYVINSLKVVNDQHFQSLSVSAQNWVNILEVPVRDLESYLLTYSAKGYTILGVEQANESTSLTEFIFPKKSILLLGNEKLGIPPELLHLVDKCIEIPQVGIIRSLNVHVTGALCIWQYTTQNIL